jgi:hypothetical protein
MTLFLLTYLLVYGSVHAYVFLKAKSALAFGWGAGLPLVAVLLLLVAAPILTHLLAREGHESAARLLAFAGYLWMGFVFFLFWLNLAADAARFLLWAAGRAGVNGVHAQALGGKAAFLAPRGCARPVGVLRLRGSRIEVGASDRHGPAPAGGPRVRIAQISDLHLGLVHRTARRATRPRSSRGRPGHLVSTGTCGRRARPQQRAVETLRTSTRRWGNMRHRNHEYYRGLTQSIEFTARPVHGLRNDPSSPAARSGSRPGHPTRDRLEDAAGGGRRRAGRPPDGRFTILLKHRPSIDPASVGRFDLHLPGTPITGRFSRSTLHAAGLSSTGWKPCRAGGGNAPRQPRDRDLGAADALPRPPEITIVAWRDPMKPFLFVTDLHGHRRNTSGSSRTRSRRAPGS